MILSLGFLWYDATHERSQLQPDDWVAPLLRGGSHKNICKVGYSYFATLNPLAPSQNYTCVCRYCSLSRTSFSQLFTTLDTTLMTLICKHNNSTVITSRRCLSFKHSISNPTLKFYNKSHYTTEHTKLARMRATVSQAHHALY